MKDHSVQEMEQALERVPKPIADFAISETLTTIYSEIAKRHKLNLRQIAEVSKVVNTTLVGLEPEERLGIEIHDTLLEFDNDALNPLVADINSLVFKEAKRRLQENIVEEDTWDETELGPKPKPEESVELISDEELDKLVEAEEKAGGFKGDEEEEGTAQTTAQNVGTAKTPAPQSIASQKIAGSVSTKPEHVASVDTPKKSATPSTQKKEMGGTDPYREPIE